MNRMYLKGTVTWSDLRVPHRDEKFGSRYQVSIALEGDQLEAARKANLYLEKANKDATEATVFRATVGEFTKDGERRDAPFIGDFAGKRYESLVNRGDFIEVDFSLGDQVGKSGNPYTFLNSVRVLKPAKQEAA